MPDPQTEPVGDLQTALAHTHRLLGADPTQAVAQAREILRVIPDQPQALLLLGTALRFLPPGGEALPVFERLAAVAPDWSPGQAALGLALADAGRTDDAIAALRRATTLDGRMPHAWRSLGDLLNIAGRRQEAEAAYARQVLASVNDQGLMEAAQALVDGHLPIAEHRLREHLNAHPTDVVAIRMLAETAACLGRYEEAQGLLEQCLELAPGFEEARRDYANILQRRNRSVEALVEIDRLLADQPNNADYLSLKAACLGRTGDQDQACELYAAVLAQHPDQPKIWMSYGHTLKAVGRAREGAHAYRRAVALAPGLGEAWWSLANLKTFRFDPADVEAMRAALAAGGLGEEDEFHLDFALGKALEDQGEWADSFDYYVKANALRRQGLSYEADETTAHVRRSKALFTQAFFAEREGRGCPAPDSIFVIGLPRSGSTLVEQILASHSQVEGASELPDIDALAKRIGGRHSRGELAAYPEALADLAPADLAALGEEFLERTRAHRRLGRPFFIDKMPNNWAHVGLIHLILPRARIIDVRRHPLACGFSGFKQHFARGQAFAYDLTDIGRWYADYVELTAHIDTVLPGRVHRVIYERLVADPEAEVRALLAHCGLDFQDGCLRFWETDRIVRTASSEQVRQPLYADAVDHWRHYEPWLDPLKVALGPVTETWAARAKTLK